MTSRPSTLAGTADRVIRSSGLVLLTALASGAAVASDADHSSQLFAADLDRPQAVVPLADDAVLVAERSGRVLRIDGRGRSDLGLVEVPGETVFYVPGTPFTEGLKDLIAVPGRPEAFLWCMTTGSERAVKWAVGRMRLNVDGRGTPTMTNEIVWRSEPQSWMRTSPPPFSGCRMLVDGADVVVAMGANSRASASGRIMRISLSASHPPQVVSTGHRNPGGIVLRSGKLWEVEHGPRGGDELNLIRPGGDYGWSGVSTGQPDDKYHRSFLATRPDAVDPVVTWSPAIAPSSMTEWRGRLYVGTLKGAGVIELTLTGDRSVAQRPFLQLGARIRDVRAGLGGHVLWVMTDGSDAQLFRVVDHGDRPSSPQQLTGGDPSGERRPPGR